VLLHGFTATALQWVHHGPAATLAEHGYRVILPDRAATATARGRTIRGPTRPMSWPTTGSH
jgi:pimeloyl-ACP methyl ester carboxylesterase